MTGCTRPGCGGTIDEDGYCSDCGLKAPQPAAASTAGASSAAPAAGGCTRPGCGGTIDEDGYCSDCGLKAPQPAGTAVPSRRAATAGTAATAAGTTVGVTGGRRTTSTSTRSSRRSTGSARRFGAGLVELPPMPRRDPAGAVMADPMVVEHQRFCPSCEKPVGRGRAGAPGRTQGFCGNCGARFSFVPTLRPGDRIDDGHYEVLGCIAHGGLGWIYLAIDHHVSERWVVLKGLINSGDPDAVAAALAERQFLAQVEHPGIVKIHDFVQEPDPVSGEDVGYIVMEYVGGRSVRDVWREHRTSGSAEPMPVEQAIAYTLEVLPALGYLHDHGLLYCDLKPDNVIHTGEQVKLLDLGGVRRIDDPDSAIYGTVGYQAPEIAEEGPSIESDIYTVGRMLAVLTLNFAGFSTSHAHQLPHRGEAPLLTEFESYHRLLRRCTAPGAADRFGSVAELEAQLVGVLREVLARREDRPRPAVSTSFGHEARVFGTDRPLDGPVAPVPTPAEFAAALPVPRVEDTDPGATFVSGITSSDPAQVLDALALAPAETPEVTVRRVRALIELGRFDDARAALDALPFDPDAWRVTWYSGLIDLARGDVDGARTAFDRCFDILPGEAAPRLALAACDELAGLPAPAAAHYATVWATDRAYVSAAFGLSRARCATGDLTGAIAALREVPETASLHRDAQLGAITALLRGRDARTLRHPELADAGTRLQALRLDPTTRAEVAAELLTLALTRVGLVAKGELPPDPDTDRLTVLGHRLAERDLRFALESCYRDIAHHAPTRELRVGAVDRANAVRPRTWW